MKYNKIITLKNNENALIRDAGANDAEEFLKVFVQTHAETDNLLTYPEEMSLTIEQEAAFLEKKVNDERSVELALIYKGKIIGTAGVDGAGGRMKIAHRCEMGISVLKEFWGLGAGKALMQACIECAKAAKYQQLELLVVKENKRAVELYSKYGFKEIGYNARGFRRKDGTYQGLMSMALELE